MKICGRLSKILNSFGYTLKLILSIFKDQNPQRSKTEDPRGQKKLNKEEMMISCRRIVDIKDLRFCEGKENEPRAAKEEDQGRSGREMVKIERGTKETRLCRIEKTNAMEEMKIFSSLRGAFTQFTLLRKVVGRQFSRGSLRGR